MFRKFILVASVSFLSIIIPRATASDLKSSDDDLQERYSALLSRNAFVSHSSGIPMSDSLSSEVQSIVSVCKSNQFCRENDKAHKEALVKLKNILRGQKDTDSFLRLAGDLRNFPEMNFHMWLEAFLSVSYERDDLVTLQKPHPIAVTPELFLSQEAFKSAKLQAQIAPENRVCIPVDGTLTTESENGKEHALWYFREDLLFGFQHVFWHYAHPSYEPFLGMDRRGEAFYYFHRTIVSRYDAERLAMGFDRVKPLVMEDGFVIEEGYFPHLIEMQSLLDYGNRDHNTTITGASELAGYMKNITDDVEQGYLIAKNGSQVSILTSRGIDRLADNVEAFAIGLNPDRYLEQGVHNQGHAVLAELSINATYGVMVALASTRDPVFYRFHKTIDNIFETNKAMLPPYEIDGGEYPLVWEGVSVTSIEITSSNTPTPNTLETFMGTQTVEVFYTPDGFDLDFGTLEYCIKRLEHTDFQYKITTARSDNSASVNATVRIFMAPRFSESGEVLSLAEQRRLFFPLDWFQVALNPGETQIIRNSTESTLTMPWKLENSGPAPTPYTPHCGCGWPHHLLLPRGTSAGMEFDLFVILTETSGIEIDSNDVCNSARILCGDRDRKYPDLYPMGYPFDRLPFNDPETNEVVSSIEKYTQLIPNSKVIQVSIFHRD